jgi:protein gp37
MKKRNLNGCPDCTAFKPHAHFERLEQPFNTKKPSLIGACYSADFWDKGFHWSERHAVFDAVTKAKQHWFINLTKQTQNIDQDIFPDNWIQGASICNEADMYRVLDLWGCRAKYLALSIEPLYQRLNNLELSDIDWVIIGGQTKPTRLPEKTWVDDIVQMAKALKIPVFIKNNLDSLGFNLHEFPSFLSSLNGKKAIGGKE